MLAALFNDLSYASHDSVYPILFGVSYFIVEQLVVALFDSELVY